ncbi:MAG: pyruvate, phosphate dikinase [Micavibrio sp.]|nr:MAG: pyruvate, phosphate dikinase [Micavibrio sp.]
MTAQPLAKTDTQKPETANTKWVYSFGAVKTEGDARLRNLLGGKGANLAEMCRIGLPVPPGFTITTEMCGYFYDHDNTYPDTLENQIKEAIERIEKEMECRFGDRENPLLLSVRSGARVSMPGMMDTVLNLGLNDDTVAGLAARSGDPRFAWDSYRRFVQMYGDVVLGVEHDMFEDILDTLKRRENITHDTEITAEGWQDIVAQYKKLVEDETGRPFPQEPEEQLWGAVGAVFKSWMVPRAITYRKLNNIPGDWGTAVNVQAMVFGNMGENCATGVAFTRDPSTGENAFYGEYLMNAQGEDVVAGIRTPQHLTVKGKQDNHSDLPAMEEELPEIFAELMQIRETLEKHYREMQDIEFTVQSGRLYMLQTRTGKRTAAAALKIAVDMAEEGLISKEEAVLRIAPETLDQLLHPMLDPDAEKATLTKGLPASPGAASGVLSFHADDAEHKAKLGHNVILCRIETSPEDIHGMYAAQGILTARGGMTSHAAVVARGMGRPCVAGAGALHINYQDKSVTVGDTVLQAGDTVTIDGATGEVFAGSVPTIQPDLSGDFEILMAWADETRGLRVRANADTPADAETARKFGAEGIGLCRTEHMFFEPDRILNVRKMILAENTAEREAALASLEPEQQGDFAGLFRVMAGLPVTIRLLDPPLHEFLPHEEEDILKLADALGLPADQLKNRIARLHEANPMLGHRGCRLGIVYPEIYAMQARAIFAAAVTVRKEGGDVPTLEIMVPLVATERELAIVKDIIDREAEKIMAQHGITDLDYMTGTMIELPRAALKADEIARSAAFFSFGTNDLTQTALGLSRDDSGSFLPYYQETGIWARDPFMTLDIDGVGELVKLGTERGRMTRPDLKIGICGEHGGDPDSIAFFDKTGLDYVSCSPYRVPIARLAAAQSALKRKTA